MCQQSWHGLGTQDNYFSYILQSYRNGPLSCFQTSPPASTSKFCAEPCSQLNYEPMPHELGLGHSGVSFLSCSTAPCKIHNAFFNSTPPDFADPTLRPISGSSKAPTEAAALPCIWRLLTLQFRNSTEQKKNIVSLELHASHLHWYSQNLLAIPASSPDTVWVQVNSSKNRCFLSRGSYEIRTSNQAVFRIFIYIKFNPNEWSQVNSIWLYWARVMVSAIVHQFFSYLLVTDAKFKNVLRNNEISEAEWLYDINPNTAVGI